MSLVFETASPVTQADPNRADVACFIGFVARRPGRALPDVLRAQLVAAGWAGASIWAKPEKQIESLENLPVSLDSWDLFDALFAWDARPLAADGSSQCATYLGAAVRSFFARGGRRAIVIRVGDPWPCLESDARRATLGRERMRRMLPDFANRSAPEYPFEPHNPARWQGIHHLYGLRENSLLLLPDLVDACSFEPPLPEVTLAPPPTPAGFVECSSDEPVEVDTGLRHVPAPRLDNRGYAAWQQAVAAARDFLANWQREVVLLAALPLPNLDAQRVTDSAGRVHAQADMLAYLQRIGVLREDGAIGASASGIASAFVQLAWPWLRTGISDDLPEGLESPDGVLAGLIAASAALRGSFRSVAGDASMPRLRDISGAEPVPSWGLGVDSPTARIARHVCVFAQAPDGWALQSDVTTASQEAWRFGGASRLMGCIRRAARAAGDSVAFDANGPAVWSRLRGNIEDLLMEFWREGAFAGATVSEAFSVRCDHSTMTQNDLDNGRLIVEISVRPAVSIEVITVVLNLGNSVTHGAVQELA